MLLSFRVGLLASSLLLSSIPEAMAQSRAADGGSLPPQDWLTRHTPEITGNPVVSQERLKTQQQELEQARAQAKDSADELSRELHSARIEFEELRERTKRLLREAEALRGQIKPMLAEAEEQAASAAASNLDPVPTGGAHISLINPDHPASPKEDSEAFASAYLQSWSSGNEQALADIREFFASQVNYLGRSIGKRDLYEAKRHFADQWPIRSYRHRPGSMSARCDEPREQCLVESIVDWEAESPERNAVSRGSFRLELGLDVSGPRPVVKSENRHRIERSQSLMQAPAARQ